MREWWFIRILYFIMLYKVNLYYNMYFLSNVVMNYVIYVSMFLHYYTRVLKKVYL